MNHSYRDEAPDFQALGIEVIEAVPEAPSSLNAVGWEVLTELSHCFENADWQRILDSVLVWNIPTASFWDYWNTDKDTMKLIGFQARPNQGEHTQATDAKWLVYFDRHQHLNFLEYSESVKKF